MIDALYFINLNLLCKEKILEKRKNFDELLLLFYGRSMV